MDSIPFQQTDEYREIEADAADAAVFEYSYHHQWGGPIEWLMIVGVIALAWCTRNRL